MKKYTFLDLAVVNAPYEKAMTEAVGRVITSGRYIGGSEVAAFEAGLSAALGVDHVVAVANGLDALRLIVRAYMELGRLKPGDEVVVPANSFVASALAVSDCGLEVRFADADPDTYNLDWDKMPCGPKVKAVMPVHLYGRVCVVPEDIRQRYVVIEDSAQAIGARGACLMGHAAGMSFYPTKNIGALGDAGAVITPSEEVAAVVRSLGNYGTDRQYHNIYMGLNSRMDPVQAAMLRVKLAAMDHENSIRRERAGIYDAHINNQLIELPKMPDDPETHVWHQYVVRVADGRRDEFRRFMESRGVETAVHYPCPIHRQPCYASRYSGLSLPVAERLAEEVVSLPVSRGTSVDDALEISAIVNEFE